MEGDFNKDGNPDTILVGVYEDKAGAMGRFLLVLTKRRPRVLEKAFLYKMEGEPGFSILSLYEDEVNFGTCLSCDTGARLVWEHGRYRLEWAESM